MIQARKPFRFHHDLHKPRQFWARPSKSSMGAADEKLVFIGVGHALSRWEAVETSIHALFSTLVDSRTIASARAFGTILGQRNKAEAITAASQIYFEIRKQLHKKDRQTVQWIGQAEDICSSLIENYNIAARRRHDVAHGMAWNLSKNPIEIPEWYLVAPLYNSLKNDDWIKDHIGLLVNTDQTLNDIGKFNEIYRKNTDYIFDYGMIKILADKFQHLARQTGEFAAFIKKDGSPPIPIQ